MGSLALVGEVYEVWTQVDRELTTVSSFDRLLRLNKNLGRHTRQTILSDYLSFPCSICLDFSSVCKNLTSK
jgi:hypothetical protein